MVDNTIALEGQWNVAKEGRHHVLIGVSIPTDEISGTSPSRVAIDRFTCHA